MFGNIQHVPVAMNKDVKRPKPHSHPGINGTSFATTVVAGSKESEFENIGKKKVGFDKKECLCCRGVSAVPNVC